MVDALNESLRDTCTHFRFEFDDTSISETFVASWKSLSAVNSKDELRIIFINAIEPEDGFINDDVLEYWSVSFCKQSTNVKRGWLNNFLTRQELGNIKQILNIILENTKYNKNNNASENEPPQELMQETLAKKTYEENEEDLLKTHEPLFNLIQSYVNHLITIYDNRQSIGTIWKADKVTKQHGTIAKLFKNKKYQLYDISSDDLMNKLVQLLNEEIACAAIYTFSFYRLLTRYERQYTAERKARNALEKELADMLKNCIFPQIIVSESSNNKDIDETFVFLVSAISQVFCDILAEKDATSKEKVLEKQSLTSSTLKQALYDVMMLIKDSDGDISKISENYVTIIDKYTYSLQKNYKDVHIYMLDERDLSDFYIEPDLVKNEASFESTKLRSSIFDKYVSEKESISRLSLSESEHLYKSFRDALSTKSRSLADSRQKSISFNTILDDALSQRYVQNHPNLSDLGDLNEESTIIQPIVSTIHPPIHTPNIKWKSIFRDSEIVYVVGGAGYGKSLFLKNIINSFQHADLFCKSDCLVVYGDIKNFIKGKNEYKSVIEFLRDSMINDSLMTPNEISCDLIKYYLNVGRCLLLLDALDEVPKADRAEIHKRLITFFQTTATGNKICITSRDRGFIPADKNIDVYYIPSLDMESIDKYVDRIILLGVRKAFNAKIKPDFMAQTEALINKGFLSSFLVLSLLVNIYSGEQKLPETKIQLYNKCFEYITRDRQIAKDNDSEGTVKVEFPRDKILYFLKESTFSELSSLCLPNNNDVDYDTVMQFLMDKFSMTFSDTAKLYDRIDCFLRFCAERTDLFVISHKENHYRFFHRSFFEYFYAKKLFNMDLLDDVFASLKQFDNDSEIFELYIAICKDNNIDKYKVVIKTLFDKIKDDNLINFTALNFFMHFLSEIEEEHYINGLLRLLADNFSALIHMEGHFVNADLFNKYVYSHFNDTEYFFSKYISVIEQQLTGIIIIPVH